MVIKERERVKKKKKKMEIFPYYSGPLLAPYFGY